MNTSFIRAAVCGLWVATVCQAAPPVTLKVDLENVVGYWDDGVEFAKLGSDSRVTTPTATRRIFQSQVQLGDIVAVNGRPAKGTFVMNARNLNVTTAFAPGQSVADTTRNGIAQYTFEFLQQDGTPIGVIFVSALNGGTPSPGAPLGSGQASSTITGGTGAFRGARGQAASAPAAVAVRNASFTEDTASRRTNGGGKVQYLLQLIPDQRPDVVMTAIGPAVMHAADNLPVTNGNPARAGETLVLYATGLGPVRGAIDVGQPFPASPAVVVNSPVEVNINGVAARIMTAEGYPGTDDGYAVTFTLPQDLTPGMADLQLTAAWIQSSVVKIPIQ